MLPWVKSMRPPCELVQKEYLPVLRARLSRRLNDRGVSQIEIAEKLLITQAAVSKYLKQQPSTCLPLDKIDTAVQKLEQMILDESETVSRMVYEICKHCIEMRIGGAICKAHQGSVRELGNEKCQICSDLIRNEPIELGERAKLLSDMNAALEILEVNDAFERVIPQVRANLVVCLKDATTTADVLGVPGRIFIFNGRATIHSSPQFGASRHTASILLWAKEKFEAVHACLCIRGSEEIISAAKKQGFYVISLNRAFADADDIIKATEIAIKRRPRTKELIAIHVPGGIGIEPILYLFGPRARMLAELCTKISNSL